jgi:type IV pilus assembly protein PilA
MPPRPTSRKTIAAVLIAVAIGGCFFVAVEGEEDYRQRVRVSRAIAETEALRRDFEAIYAQTRSFPNDRSALGLPRKFLQDREPETVEDPGRIAFDIDLVDGSIVAVFSAAQGAVSGRSIVFKPNAIDGKISWQCFNGSVEQRYMPATCRPR